MTTDRDAAILSLRPVVMSLARRYARGWYEMREELQSEGWIGACRAVDSYDPARDIPLGAYARRRISGAMLDWMRDQDHLPRRMRADLAEDDPRRLPQESLDERWANLNPPAPGDLAQTVSNRVTTLAALGRLTQRDRRVVVERFWQDRTHKAIGADLGVSESRACQIVTQSLAAMHDAVA